MLAPVTGIEPGMIRPCSPSRAFQSHYRSPADPKRNAANNSKAAIDETPQKRNTAVRTGDESQRKNSRARDQAESDHPLVANRIDIRTNKRNCDDHVSECEPVCTVSKEG